MIPEGDGVIQSNWKNYWNLWWYQSNWKKYTNKDNTIELKKLLKSMMEILCDGIIQSNWKNYWNLWWYQYVMALYNQIGKIIEIYDGTNVR